MAIIIALCSAFIVCVPFLFVVVGPNTFSLPTIRLLSHLFQMPLANAPVRGQQTSAEQSGCKCVSGIRDPSIIDHRDTITGATQSKILVKDLIDLLQSHKA